MKQIPIPLKTVWKPTDQRPTQFSSQVKKIRLKYIWFLASAPDRKGMSCQEGDRHNLRWSVMTRAPFLKKKAVWSSYTLSRLKEKGVMSSTKHIKSQFSQHFYSMHINMCRFSRPLVRVNFRGISPDLLPNRTEQGRWGGWSKALCSFSNKDCRRYLKAAAQYFYLADIELTFTG